ncbi:ATP-binding protein [Spirosoma endophyticum]|uniref:Tetratricopeptide repeat-containing protein n=1 Tax=Spirosoma endophyticum TaxID=662367 RepID=A0A1I1IPB9_9BACT|nr:ATP-binding protein [Spirosoma endophyticum]SFC38149.1 Tetratricopeptide repeat-containing protein [Spirosoma endophyticum]
MKKLLLFLCLLAQIGFSQTSRIDSLKRELRILDKQPNGYSKDTLQFKILKAIMRDYADVNIDSSSHYNTLIIELCSNPKLQKELIYAYQFAGYLFQVRGDYSQSILYHYKALPLAEKLRQYTRVAASLGWLAHAYTSLKDYAKAEKLSQQGLTVLKQHPDTYDAYVHATILNVLGAMYRGQSKFTNALKVNQEMYELSRRHHVLWYEAQGLHTIGWDYMEMGNRTKPLDYYQSALVLARKIGSADLEESILLHIADVYIQQKKWSKALKYCNWARQTAIHLKNSSIVAEADEKLYTIFKQLNEPAKALKAYEDFVILRDSLSKEKTQQRIEMLQAQYDNVQKTNALQNERVKRLAEKNRNQQLAQTRNGLFIGMIVILLITALLVWNNRRLQAKNRKIDQQRALLESARKQLTNINKTLETRVQERTEELLNANKELIQTNERIKAALFKGQTIERKRVALELHDNLSSLLSAVNMSIQSINPQNLSEPEQSVYRNVKLLIQNAYAEVRNISHNILPAELEREGLAATLATLINRLNQNSALVFSLTVTSLQERLPIEIEFNVYSIILELINNVIKHAKATTVGIRIFRTDIGVNLSVTDDGVGMSLNRGAQGIGLQNIQTRLDSLGGTFDIMMPAEKGTRMVIKIPIETVHVNGDVSSSVIG